MPNRISSIAGLITAALVLSACGNSGNVTNATPVAVAASDKSCVLDVSSIESGATIFTVTNTGNEVTEVYVYAPVDGSFTSVVAEVENIGPGTSRDMDVMLDGGVYEVACKPGQTGSGIRAKLTVRGEASTGSTGTTPVNAREVDLGIDSSDALKGAATIAPELGERLEFKVTNNASGVRVFEVKRPDGSVAGEIEIAVGAEGELYVDLTSAGDWLLIVEGGAAETEAGLSVN